MDFALTPYDLVHAGCDHDYGYCAVETGDAPAVPECPECGEPMTDMLCYACG